MNLKINATTIEKVRLDFGGYLVSGTVELFGAMHHVRMVRVRPGDIVEPFGDATTEVTDTFQDIINFNDGALARCLVPGLPGLYVMVIYPFAD